MERIIANWQAPTNVQGFTTTRQGGVSLAPFDSFNLGDHVGDDKNNVKINRTLLEQAFDLPNSPLFLNQTHSTTVLRLPQHNGVANADAVYTNQPNQICLVMTADCLPILLTNQAGTEVAAVHAGWRGLCNGILEATLAHFQSPTQQIIAWLGPAIGKTAFQVGQEVKEQFMAIDPQAELAFTPDQSAVGNHKYFADLYQLARQRLNRQGVSQISGGEYCTYQEQQYFFSYRRDGQTGRMASLVWFE